MDFFFYVSSSDTDIGLYHRILAVKEKKLLKVEDYLSRSSIAVICALFVSHTTVLRILHEEGMHLYHLQRVCNEP